MKQKFALLGEKLGHSYSPLIHQRILEVLGQNGDYVNMEIAREQLAQTLDTLKTQGYTGVNVTIPYKQAIMPYLDEITPEARRIGAVNTVSFAGGRTVGHNTDAYGFLAMLEIEGIAAAGRRALVLGTGGAAVSAIAALEDAGAASVLVAGRGAAQLARVQEQFPLVTTCMLEDTARLEGELLVNTTPVGMFPDSGGCPVPPGIVRRFAAVVDCIYNPTPTILVHTAQEQGIPACCGMYMLVLQAMRAQEIWQGQTIAREAAKPIYDELLA